MSSNSRSHTFKFQGYLLVILLTTPHCYTSHLHQSLSIFVLKNCQLCKIVCAGFKRFCSVNGLRDFYPLQYLQKDEKDENLKIYCPKISKFFNLVSDTIILAVVYDIPKNLALGGGKIRLHRYAWRHRTKNYRV